MKFIKNMELKWKILFFGTFAQLGGFMAINFPAFMYLALLQAFKIDSIQFNILYTVISFPNIISPFFIGYLTSKVFDYRKMLVMTVFCTFFGATLQTISILTQKFELLIIGRFFVGIGHTNINSPRNEIITKYFKYSGGMAFAFSCFTTLGRIGILFIAWICSLYQNEISHLYIPVMFINLVCLNGLICALAVVYMDLKEEELEWIEEENYQMELQQNLEGLETEQLPDINKKFSACSLNSQHDEQIKQKQEEFLIKLREEKRKNDLSKNLKNSQNNSENSENQAVEHTDIQLKNQLRKELKEKQLQKIKNDSIFQLKNFPPSAILIAALSCLGCLIFFPYCNNIQLFLNKKYSLSGKFTVYIQTITNIMSAILGPIFGSIIDRNGKITVFYIFSGFLTILAYIFSLLPQGAIFPNNDMLEAVLPIIFLGLFWSIFPIIEAPALSIILEQKFVGFAVGIVLSLINLLQSIAAIYTGYLLSLQDGVTLLSSILLGFACFYVILSIILFIIDYQDKTVGKEQPLYKIQKAISKNTGGSKISEI